MIDTIAYHLSFLGKMRQLCFDFLIQRVQECSIRLNLWSSFFIKLFYINISIIIHIVPCASATDETIFSSFGALSPVSENETCFVYRDKTVQKFIWVLFNSRKLSLEIVSIQSENAAPILPKLFHMLCNKLETRSYEIFTVLAIFLYLARQSTI